MRVTGLKLIKTETKLMVVAAMSTSEARAKLLELDSRRKSLEEELKLVSQVFFFLQIEVGLLE